MHHQGGKVLSLLSFHILLEKTITGIRISPENELSELTSIILGLVTNSDYYEKQHV